MSISKDGIPLTSLADWECLAGPRRSNQWVDHRSAKEAARAWLEGGIDLPREIHSLLTQHSAFGPVLDWQAEPEAKLAFDTFRGEPRNSDLVIDAKDSHGPYLIAVEAKADEPFGETLGEALAAALERYLTNNRSNGLKRIEQLSQTLLGPRQPQDPPLEGIRYQLLTATAGALCEAERRGCNRAVLLIHEFVTNRTSDDKHARNAVDLDTFASRLSHGLITSVGSDSLRGPFELSPATQLGKSVALYIGKASRHLRNTSNNPQPSC
jgi:Domain of unknown function (DUF6946)